ncbi:unnamed protein product [Cyprideis torosa]|uniref:Laminin N-terminal domain-containing protein n=1 Tax=Cyprideis torosa TaxID=163714 RepID=A0A7R8W9I7_9CRUS|nr:unnamed protein product [Cyprideis torosa]CAG0888583.1 unnamed protein product [Cyprideis torosa]
MLCVVSNAAFPLRLRQMGARLLTTTQVSACSKGAESASSKNEQKSDVKAPSEKKPKAEAPNLMKEIPIPGVREIPSTPVGPGASKTGEYKCPEYYCYNSMSYIDIDVAMSTKRLPQPSSVQDRTLYSQHRLSYRWEVATSMPLQSKKPQSKRVPLVVLFHCGADGISFVMRNRREELRWEEQGFVYISFVAHPRELLLEQTLNYITPCSPLVSSVACGSLQASMSHIVCRKHSVVTPPHNSPSCPPMLRRQTDYVTTKTSAPSRSGASISLCYPQLLCRRTLHSDTRENGVASDTKHPRCLHHDAPVIEDLMALDVQSDSSSSKSRTRRDPPERYSSSTSFFPRFLAQQEDDRGSRSFQNQYSSSRSSYSSSRQEIGGGDRGSSRVSSQFFGRSQFDPIQEGNLLDHTEETRDLGDGSVYRSSKTYAGPGFRATYNQTVTNRTSTGGFFDPIRGGGSGSLAAKFGLNRGNFGSWGGSVGGLTETRKTTWTERREETSASKTSSKDDHHDDLPEFRNVHPFVLLGGLDPATYANEGSNCEQASCYPETGNLLIGREKNLTASSTCGLQRKERYCVVGLLEAQGKRCFDCYSGPGARPDESHGVEQMISRRSGTNRETWWQSENGVEKVQIQLDLESRFHFHWLLITFRTFVPAGMILEKSADFGRTWQRLPPLLDRLLPLLYRPPPLLDRPPPLLYRPPPLLYRSPPLLDRPPPLLYRSPPLLDQPLPLLDRLPPLLYQPPSSCGC